MIAKALVNILMTDAAVTSEINDRLYPIIDIPEISENEKLAATYYYVKMNTVHAKNGPSANDHEIMILAVASSYQKCWEIALKIRDALLYKTGTFKDVEVRFPRNYEIADDYEFTPINMYGVKIAFNIRTAYY